VTAGGVVVAPKVVHHTRHRAAAHAAPAPTPAERKAVASFRRPPTLGAVLPSTRRAAPQGTSDVHRVVSARPESKNESDATKERAEPRGSEPGGGDRRQQNRPRQGDGHDGSAPAAQSPSPSPNQQPRQDDPFSHDSSSAPTTGSAPDTGFPAGSSEWPYGRAADLREADVHDMQEPRRPPG
jgi:hypothetical protein